MIGGIAWIAAAVASLAAGAFLVCPAGECRTLAFDEAALVLAQGWQARWLDAGFAALTWLGSLYVLIPLSLLLAWRMQAPWRGYLPLAVVGAAVLAHAAKLIVLRPRPELYPALVDMPADASFPSAHTMQAAAFVVAWLWRPGASPGIGALLAAASLALLVSFSRIHLQVHFPSDVVFGAAAGICWALALRSLFLRRAALT